MCYPLAVHLRIIIIKELVKQENNNQILSLDWTYSQIAPASSKVPSEVFNPSDYPNSKINSEHLLLIPINNSVEIKFLEPIISIINNSNHVLIPLKLQIHRIT